MIRLRLTALHCVLMLALLPAAVYGLPVTGWVRDTSFGGGSAASLTSANTSSPILGSGAANNADNVAIYAPMSLVSLFDAQQVVLTGSAEFIGTSSVGDFRWGLFKDDGAAPAHAGWLGYMGSAETNVWSKDPTGTSFTTTTFASVANGRGFTLGQMSEPNGNFFDPGTYAFNMTVQRFGNESLVKVAITNSTTGFTIETPLYAESNASRRTFDFDRVGFLAGSALDADQVRFSNIDVTAGDIVAPTLKVFSSGLAFITNPFNEAFELTHYEISSASGGLNTGGWLSLDDQENNDPIGVGWEEAGGSNGGILAEVNLVSSAMLTSGASLKLGHAFNPSSAKDLAFQFTVGEKILRGPVKYALTGDYNGDGKVDAADYVVWRKTLGQSIAFGAGADGDGDGVIGTGDYAAWRNAFASIQTPAAAASIPEPAAIGCICVAGLIAVGVRGRRSRRLSSRGRLTRNFLPIKVPHVATAVLCALPCALAPLAGAAEINQVAGNLITFNTNGGWSWYQDERAIVDTAAGKLLMSSAADASGTDGAARNGDIDIVQHDLASGQTNRFVLHAGLGADDHNAAALLIRQDGRYLAMYTRHNADKFSYYRVSTNPHDATSWQAEQSFDWATTPGSDFNVTYTNLFYLSAENRTYDFSRANNRSPNILTSMNDGSSWTYGGKLVNNPSFVGYVNGYFKYASNGVDRIDFIATEHHPRDFNNNIYHGYIKAGQMFRSDGSLLDASIFDNSAPNQTALTKIFQSDPENGSQVNTRAWTTDLHVDASGNPYAIFTTRRDDIPVNTNGYNDHRFWYARYDGNQWNVHQLAKAGARLYPSEQDYTGLVALDPSNPNRLFISSTIDPRNDTSLPVHEIFEGTTADGGASWNWTPITFNSKSDNVRPIVPIWDASHTALVWMRGKYNSQVNYDMDIVGLTAFGPLEGFILGDLNGDHMLNLVDFSTYVSYMHTSLSGLTGPEAYARGDLNGDFKNDAHDFLLFRGSYDDENGAGAFAAALAGVPEPGTAGLLVVAGIVLNSGWRLRRSVR